MGEAAEALDDFAMALRITQQLFAERRDEIASQVLVVQRLTVLEWQPGKQPLVGR